MRLTAYVAWLDCRGQICVTPRVILTYAHFSLIVRDERGHALTQ
jgi:hypothetical protein